MAEPSRNDRTERIPTTAQRALALWDWLFAAGALLTLATQLRPASSPLGPGEALLTLWLAPVLAVEVLRLGRRVPRPLSRIVRFWGVLAFALCLGVVTSIVTDVANDWSLVMHDVEAYALLVALTIALTAPREAGERMIGLQWRVAVVGAALLTLQLVNANGTIAFGSVDPWYWDRMRGWADNPNQFALFCLALGFLDLSLVERSRSAAGQTVAAIFAVAALGAGFLAKSNAYAAVVMAALGLIVVLKAARAIARAERRGFPALGVAAALFGAAALALAIAVPIVGVDPGSLKGFGAMGREDAANDEDAALRVALWAQAIERGVSAGGLGLGPGPHLDIPGIVLAGRRAEAEPINMVHPKLGLAPNFESHNTLLELFVQGGALALGAFLWICGAAVVRAWRSGEDGLIALLVAIGAYGSFHVVFRHPLVWFAICLALTASARASPARAAASPERRGGARPSAIDRRLLRQVRT